MTIADILKRTNTRIGDNSYWLVWNETQEEWVIYRDTRRRKNRVVVWMATRDEAAAVDEMLRLLGADEEE